MPMGTAEPDRDNFPGSTLSSRVFSTRSDADFTTITGVSTTSSFAPGLPLLMGRQSSRAMAGVEVNGAPASTSNTIIVLVCLGTTASGFCVTSAGGLLGSNCTGGSGFTPGGEPKNSNQPRTAKAPWEEVEVVKLIGSASTTLRVLS